MESYLVGFFAALFVILGLLVRKYPKLIVGYNTMSPERQQMVDVKGLVTFMCRSFCLVGVLVIVMYFLLLWKGLNKETAVLVSVLLVPMLGAVYMLVGAQRYDHGK